MRGWLHGKGHVRGWLDGKGHVRGWPCLAAVALLGVWSQEALADGAPQQPAPAPAAVQAPKAHAGAAKRPLDLSAPPISHVLTPQQVESFLTEPDEDSNPPEDVTVKSERYVAPVPPGGAFVALPWALLHPLQAWRIFAPITTD